MTTDELAAIRARWATPWDSVGGPPAAEDIHALLSTLEAAESALSAAQEALDSINNNIVQHYGTLVSVSKVLGDLSTAQQELVKLHEYCDGLERDLSARRKEEDGRTSRS
jgi:predicted  nucleic acid-binding Zn-ribbon protein